MNVQPSGASCGASVTGLQLSDLNDQATVDALREAWLTHKIIAIHDFALTLDELQLVASYFGPFGEDPFFESLPSHPHVAEVKRLAGEIAPLFAGGWHSDWSFLPGPPTATLLYGSIVPPIGGDTLFADQVAAWEALEPALKDRVANLQGIHSARRSYAPDGFYGEKDEGRSMAIRYSEDAYACHPHPIGRPHEETGATALFVSPAYTIGIDGMDDAEADEILRELYAHQGQEAFVHRQRWEPNMLVIWDNRSVVHMATGGYEGHDRVLQRVTVAPKAA